MSLAADTEHILCEIIALQLVHIAVKIRCLMLYTHYYVGKSVCNYENLIIEDMRFCVWIIGFSKQQYVDFRIVADTYSKK